MLTLVDDKCYSGEKETAARPRMNCEDLVNGPNMQLGEHLTYRRVGCKREGTGS